MVEQVSVDRIRTHVQALQGVRHPVAAPAALSRAAEYITCSLQSLGYSISHHAFADGGSSFGNIIGSLEGTRHPDRRILIVAHFDTVSGSPGADDNASGVAVMLEVARVLRPLRFQRSIEFIAVNLEENSGADGTGEGTRGSRALARDAREQGWEIEGVVVLESVAYAGASVAQSAPEGVPFEVPEAGDFIAVVANERSESLAQGVVALIEKLKIPLPYFSLVVPGNGEALPDTRRSDHAPFWDSGFKAIMLTDTTNFRNPHYHLSSDTLETLNLSFAAEVGRATAALVAELAGAEEG